MIGTLVFLHRWLGVAFCLLFAIWFASGVVMHFVLHPSFTAADRRAGLAPIDLAQAKALPSEALAAGRIENTAVAILNYPGGNITGIVNRLNVLLQFTLRGGV